MGCCAANDYMPANSAKVHPNQFNQYPGMPYNAHDKTGSSPKKPAKDQSSNGNVQFPTQGSSSSTPNHLLFTG